MANGQKAHLAGGAPATREKRKDIRSGVNDSQSVHQTERVRICKSQEDARSLVVGMACGVRPNGLIRPRLHLRTCIHSYNQLTSRRQRRARAVQVSASSDKVRGSMQDVGEMP